MNPDQLFHGLGRVHADIHRYPCRSSPEGPMIISAALSSFVAVIRVGHNDHTHRGV